MEITENILEVKNLNVKFGNETVIRSLTFEVKRGEIFVILGPNGAGKTVLLRALLGLVPCQGEVRWAEGVRIGYVPQRVPFAKDFPLSVGEFFRLKKLSKNKIDKILTMTGLPVSLGQKPVSTLSSGQFQRILIGWALAGDPSVLLFDEPTSGIDIGGEETIYNLLSKIKEEKGLTIILVSHDLNVVYEQADNVLCLNKKMFCSGAPGKILTSHSLSELFGGGLAFYQHKHKHD